MRLAAILLLCGVALGQDCPPHRFLDTQNTVMAGSFLAFTAADALATERNWAHGPGWYESNPIMPSTTAGRAAYFAGATAATLGTSYVFHKTGHHKLERWTLRIANVTEAGYATWTWTHQ